MFFPEVSQYFGGDVKRGLYTGSGGRESKFRQLEEGERSLTKVWSSQGSSYFIHIGQWVQIIRLIIHEAKNANLVGLCLAFL